MSFGVRVTRMILTIELELKDLPILYGLERSQARKNN